MFNPSKRITIDEALTHPYLAALHCPGDEPMADPVQIEDFEFENHNLTLQQLKDLIYEEILLYHFPDFKSDYESRKANHENLILHVINNENS